MYLLNQDIANQIAQTQQLATEEMRVLFESNEAHAKELENELKAEILKETLDEEVALAIVSYLPLLVEHKAITKYIKSKEDYGLRIQFPEIMTPDEAALFAELEFSLNQDQTILMSRVMERKCATMSQIHTESEDFINFS